MTASAYEIAKALGGKRSGTGWLIRCPNPAHDDRNPSCVVSDDHNGQPIFYCFAGCHWQDIKAGAERLGLVEPFKPGEGQSFEERQAQRLDQLNARRERQVEQAERDAKRVSYAKTVWDEALPDNGRADRYFKARGISKAPALFRYIPDAWHTDGKTKLQAIVAPIEHARSGAFQGCYRIFLNDKGDGKASVSPPKKALGLVNGGAVKLGEPDDTLAICEGIETGLSYQQLSGTPTWAVLGTSGFKTFEPPTDVKELIIAADNDVPGREAAKAAASNLSTKGVRVQVTWPKTEGADFNDVLAGASS